MLYVDSSAAIKLLVTEDGSHAVREFVTGRELFSSALLRVELSRWGHRRGFLTRDIQNLGDAISSIEISSMHLKVASTFEFEHLGTLDALHLATALLAEADSMITYDRQLAAAASEVGIRVVSPA